MHSSLFNYYSTTSTQTHCSKMETQFTIPFFLSDQQERNTMASKTLTVPPNSDRYSVYLDMEGDDVTTTEPTAEDATSNENPAVEGDGETTDNTTADTTEATSNDKQEGEEGDGETTAPDPSASTDVQEGEEVNESAETKNESTTIDIPEVVTQSPTDTSTAGTTDGASPVSINMSVTENKTQIGEPKKGTNKKIIIIAILCSLFALLALGGISYGIYYFITTDPNEIITTKDPVYISDKIETKIQCPKFLRIKSARTYYLDAKGVEICSEDVIDYKQGKLFELQTGAVFTFPPNWPAKLTKACAQMPADAKKITRIDYECTNVDAYGPRIKYV